jgi:hypothetical protein
MSPQMRLRVECYRANAQVEAVEALFGTVGERNELCGHRLRRCPISRRDAFPRGRGTER